VTALAALNGTPIMRLLLVLPFSGIWHADALLTTDTVVGTPNSLLFAGTTYACAVIRDIDFAGRRMLRLVGGSGGWRTVIAGKQYASALGVPTEAVLVDAASAAGEPPPVIDPSVPTTLGPGWVRPNDKASVTLRQVLGGAWWVDPSGVVQTATRDASAVPSQFTAIAVQGAPGIVRVATESPGDWLPGRTFTGTSVSGTINRVMHLLEGEKLRTEVMVTP
jgi:hypothetical protein